MVILQEAHYLAVVLLAVGRDGPVAFFLMESSRGQGYQWNTKSSNHLKKLVRAICFAGLSVAKHEFNPGVQLALNDVFLNKS